MPGGCWGCLMGAGVPTRYGMPIGCQDAHRVPEMLPGCWGCPEGAQDAYRVLVMPAGYQGCPQGAEMPAGYGDAHRVPGMPRGCQGRPGGAGMPAGYRGCPEGAGDARRAPGARAAAGLWCHLVDCRLPPPLVPSEKMLWSRAHCSGLGERLQNFPRGQVGSLLPSHRQTG